MLASCMERCLNIVEAKLRSFLGDQYGYPAAAQSASYQVPVLQLPVSTGFTPPPASTGFTPPPASTNFRPQPSTGFTPPSVSSGFPQPPPPSALTGFHPLMSMSNIQPSPPMPTSFQTPSLMPSSYQHHQSLPMPAAFQAPPSFMAGNYQQPMHNIESSNYQPYPQLSMSSSSASNEPPPTSTNTPALIPVHQVIASNQTLIQKKKWKTLAQTIARESIFGAKVMAKCTPTGCGVTGKAPKEGLKRLKEEMFKLFPEYQGCPKQFEPTWRDCKRTVEQCCGRLRRKAEGNK